MSQNSRQTAGCKENPVSHIYAFASTWVLLISINEVSPNLFGFFVLFFSSLVVSVIVWVISFKIRLIKKLFRAIFRIFKPAENKAKDNINESAPVPSVSPTPTTPTTPNINLENLSSSDADLIRQSMVLLDELENTKSNIQNQHIVQEATEILQLSKGILRKATKKPELIPTINRFFNYYVPTANKLVTSYRDFEKQVVKGDNILLSKKKIEEALDMLKNALKKQLDTLFFHTAIDLEADVNVLENILKKEGLLQDNLMATPTNEYENNDKESAEIDINRR